jgi:CobQ-like glutamine amidotransferase family enzyme
MPTRPRASARGYSSKATSLLPKNVWFADWLIETALGRADSLEPLDDDLEAGAHAEARRAAGV